MLALNVQRNGLGHEPVSVDFFQWNGSESDVIILREGVLVVEVEVTVSLVLSSELQLVVPDWSGASVLADGGLQGGCSNGHIAFRIHLSKGIVIFQESC